MNDMDIVFSSVRCCLLHLKTPPVFLSIIAMVKVPPEMTFFVHRGVCIGAGIGITLLVSILRDIYRLDADQSDKSTMFRTHLREVYLVWTVQNEQDWYWFEYSVIGRAKALSAAAGDSAYPTLHVQGNVTRPKDAQVVENLRLHTGRPDIGIAFDCIEQQMMNAPSSHQTCAVYTCGPRKMANTVWKQARKRSKGNLRFDCEVFVF